MRRPCSFVTKNVHPPIRNYSSWKLNRITCNYSSNVNTHNIWKRRQCSEMIIVLWHDSILIWLYRCHKPWSYNARLPHCIQLYRNYKTQSQHTIWPFRAAIIILHTTLLHKYLHKAQPRAAHTPSTRDNRKASLSHYIDLVDTVKWTLDMNNEHFKPKQQQKHIYMCRISFSL